VKEIYLKLVKEELKKSYYTFRTMSIDAANLHAPRCHPGLLKRDPEDFQTRYPGFPIVRVGNDIGGVRGYLRL